MSIFQTASQAFQLMFFTACLRITVAVVCRSYATKGPPITAPPFTYNLDQSVPCPEGSQDYILSDSGGGEPLSPTSDPEISSVLSAVPQHLQQALVDLKSLSAGVLVSHQGKMIFNRFVGSAREGMSSPPSADTGFLIASITKTFTSAMMYKLRDEGRLPPLGIDAPVTALLPTFSIRSSFAGGGGVDRITLRTLAMHASGLPREVPECISCSSLPTTEEMLREIAKLEALSPPWQTTHYSNLGLALLGRALEKAANKTWERYVEEEILKPLGLTGSGNPPWTDASARERMADGIDDAGKVVVLANSTSWRAPCGSMYSTPTDMATWMSFLMDVGSAELRARWANVISASTRAEVRNTGILQGDGISAVGGGTFESAYFAGRRWGASKLGCVDGYRSAITLVPSLGLGVFGVATSTCDMYGDGDAVSFPIVAKLVPVIEKVLQRRAVVRDPLPPSASAMQGLYCDIELRIENVTWDRLGGVGQVLVARGRHGEYPFVLKYLGSVQGRITYFRKVMGPEQWLPRERAGCSSSDAPGANLCPVSCFRQMTRGSGAIVTVSQGSDGRYEYQGCMQKTFSSAASALSVSADLASGGHPVVSI